MNQPPPPIALDDDPSSYAQTQALALAQRVVPLLTTTDGGDACLAVFVDALHQAGLRATVRDVAGQRVLVATSTPGGDPSAPHPAAAATVGLCAALRRAPAAWAAPGTPLADLLVPSGAWSACLALGTTLAAAAHGFAGVTAIVELEADPAAAPHADADADADADAWLDALFAAQSLLIGGDGGLPFTDGRHVMLPVTAGIRGVLWAEVCVDLDALDAESAGLAAASQAGAAAVLVDVLGRLPAFSPVPGPLLRALHDGFAAVVDPANSAWLDDLLDPARQHIFFEHLQPREQAFVNATQTPSLTVTRLDAGERPDALPRHARAVLDLRAPADRDVETLWPLLEQLAAPGVSVRMLAIRPPQLLLPPHPVYTGLRAVLDSSGQAIGIIASQARREQRGTFWLQHQTPVLGFAPAWPGLDVDAEPAVSLGALAVSSEGLAWGAALFARLVFGELLGGASFGAKRPSATSSVGVP